MRTEIVNPARAGMIPVWWTAACHQSCKPRASGDDPMHGSVYMEAGM